MMDGDGDGGDGRMGGWLVRLMGRGIMVVS